MTTLELSPTFNGSAVRIVLVPSATISEIIRSDANGNAPVRVPAGTFPRDTILEITDYEAELGSTVTYTAGVATSRISLAGELPVLVTPLRPAMSRIVDMVTEYDAGRNNLGTIHQGIDRPDPIVALGRLATRSGALRAWLPSVAAARSLEDSIDRAGVVLYKQLEHPGLDMYFTTTGTSLAQDQEGEGWILTISYQEITRPTSPINETVWTFGTVATSYASFDNVTSSYDDFEALSINDDTDVA